MLNNNGNVYQKLVRKFIEMMARQLQRVIEFVQAYPIFMLLISVTRHCLSSFDGYSWVLNQRLMTAVGRFSLLGTWNQLVRVGYIYTHDLMFSKIIELVLTLNPGFKKSKKWVEEHTLNHQLFSGSFIKSARLVLWKFSKIPELVIFWIWKCSKL